ncbi:33559_t:CDS:2 [Gigaspora margarita]|uniref:33559_t:CDS:1 n=1 Tax=Gigaspora margarita TaxID=4874 RepID=A0ABN7V9S5_GIGMA|nr:33559_t:CDS:2 [Gigaspora margarita]
MSRLLNLVRFPRNFGNLKDLQSRLVHLGFGWIDPTLSQCYDPIPQIRHQNNIDTLPSGNRAHKMPDNIMLWIQKLQYCLENIYELFGNKLIDAESPTLKEISYIKLLKEDLSSGYLNTFGLSEALTHHDFFEEFEAFAGSDVAEPAKFHLVYEFIKYRIWSITVHQQQLEGLFNCYDMKVHPNMNVQLQKSRIQLSGLDGGVQKISQDALRNIQKEINNSKGTKQLESVEISKEEKAHEILSNFLTWRRRNKATDTISCE